MYILIAFLVLLGFTLLALELLLLPGTTVVGVLGLVSLVGADWLVFSFYGSTPGYLVLAALILLSVVFLVVVLRSRTWKKLQLDAAIDSRVNEAVGKLRVGQKAVTVSRMAPTGTIEIEGELYEAQSLSAFIDQRTPVRVSKVEGSKIWVESDRTSASDTESIAE